MTPHLSLTCCLFLFLSFLSGMLPHVSKAQERIAILGCHRQYQPAPALYRYVLAEPDVSIWVGDNVYADTKDDPSVIEDAYAQLEAKPAFRALREQSVFLATWDDHDYGYNNLGKEYTLKKESKALFRDFWGLHDDISPDQPGIYYARTFQVDQDILQVILLDIRYNRDEPHSGGDVLGETQWAWFEKQLQQPATLRFVVSGMQVLLESETAGSETWDQFPEARQRLFDTIKENRAEGVVFITGDQHYAEVVRMPGVLDYDAIELQFASVNQIEEPEFNPYRVSPVAQSLHSYALVDVQWEQNEFDIPHLTFSVFDAQDDRTELTYRVNFSELKRTVSFTEKTTFVGSHKVQLKHAYPDLHIRYTLDGSKPDKDARRYVESLDLSQSATVTAALFDDEGRRRSTFQERYYEQLAVQESTSLREDLKRGLRYQYAEGNFITLPDFDSLTVLKRGTAVDFNVASIASREDHYAIQFSGYLEVPETGLYEFATYSDDGSKLFLNGQLVVDNDGSHSARLRSGEVALEKGLHQITLHYFEDYDGQVLNVLSKMPGGRQMVPLSFDHLFYTAND